MKLDYAAIRQRVSIREVLELIDFHPSHIRQNQWRGRCPLYRCESNTCGPGAMQDALQACFSVHLTRHIFRCFRCNRTGNALDLWAEISHQCIYFATIDLCKKLGIAPIPQIVQPKLQP